MAALELVFEIEGDTQLIRRLNDVSEDFKNWSSEFSKVGDLLKKSFRDNFSTEGSDLGSPWAPLSARTLAYKAKHGFPADILVRTTRMREGFYSQSDAVSVLVGNKQPYFVFHQSNRPRSRLPRRVMMKLDEKRKQLIVKVFQEAAADKLKSRGFVKK